MTIPKMARRYGDENEDWVTSATEMHISPDQRLVWGISTRGIRAPL